MFQICVRLYITSVHYWSTQSGVVRSCGHTLCMPCVEKFVAKDHKCFVCDTPVPKISKDVVKMQQGGTGCSPWLAVRMSHWFFYSCAGTGFAAHNEVEATRFDVAART